MKYVKIFVIPLLIFTFLFFCSDQGLTPDQIKYVIPETDISYYEHLQPMFEGKCGWGSGCHNETFDGGDNFLFFGTKDAFIQHEIPGSGGTLLLDPLLMHVYQSNPELSPLYNILTPQSYFGYERQPPASYGRPSLNENQINGILQWIREGAPD